MKIAAALLVSCLVLIPPAPGFSQPDCENYTDHLHLESCLLPQSDTVDAAFLGEYAITADDGLHIYDLRVPGSYSQVGSLQSAAEYLCVSTSGTLAIAGTKAYELHVVDCGNPQSPALIGSLTLSASPREIVILDDHAYVALGDLGIAVVSIADPTDPVLLQSIKYGFFAMGIAKAEDHILVAAAYEGIRVYGILGDYTLELRATVATGGTALDVAVESEVAVVATGIGLETYGASGLPALDLIGSRLTKGWTVSLGTTEGRALVSTIPRYGARTGKHPLLYEPPAAALCDSGGMGIVEPADAAYVAGTGLEVFELSATGVPSALGIFPLSSAARGIDVRSDRALVADGPNGLEIVAVGDGSLARDAVNIGLGEEIREIQTAGSYAYLASLYRGLVICDVSDPLAPTEVAAFPELGEARGVQIDGGYLYLATNTQVVIIDLADPTAGTVLSRIPLDGKGIKLAVRDGFLVVLRILDNHNLAAFDVSDPTHPAFLWDLPTVGGVLDIAIVGDFVLAGTSKELRAVLIEDPHETPVVIETIRCSSYGIAATDDFVYVASGSSGINVYDRSALPRLQVVQNIDLPDNTYDLGIRGRYCYAANASRGMQILDIADPGARVLAGTAVTPSIAISVLATDQAIYIADRFAGLQVACPPCGGDAIEVAIDVKPGNEENRINCQALQGVVDVLILSEAGFDATDVDESTLLLAGAPIAYAGSRPMLRVHDYDRDGIDDVVCTFGLQETSIECGDDLVELTGATHRGLRFRGVDRIRTLPHALRDGETTGMATEVWPNPFNPRTTISLRLDASAHVNISVYDLRGHLVTTLLDEYRNAGDVRVEWFGTTGGGRSVPSGTYFARIRSDDDVSVRRLILLK